MVESNSEHPQNPEPHEDVIPNDGDILRMMFDRVDIRFEKGLIDLSDLSEEELKILHSGDSPKVEALQVQLALRESRLRLLRDIGMHEEG